MKKVYYFLIFVFLVGCSSHSTVKPTSVVNNPIDNFAGVTDIAGVKINLPKVDNFFPIRLDSKQYTYLASSVSGAGNWLLFTYTIEDEANRINSGDLIDMSNYIIVKISKRSLNSRISQTDWEKASQKISKELKKKKTWKSVDTEAVMKKSKTQIKQDHGVEIDISIGETKIIKDPIFRDGILSFTIVVEVNSKLVLVKSNMLVVKEKILSVFVYNTYDGDKTVKEVDDLSFRFLSNLKSIN